MFIAMQYVPTLVTNFTFTYDSPVFNVKCVKTVSEKGLIFFCFGAFDIKTFESPHSGSSITADAQQHDCFNLV